MLRPGGRLAIADVVAEQELDPAVTVDAASWVDCMDGALTQGQYLATLAATGFVGPSIQFSHDTDRGFASVIVHDQARHVSGTAGRGAGVRGRPGRVGTDRSGSRHRSFTAGHPVRHPGARDWQGCPHMANRAGSEPT